MVKMVTVGKNDNHGKNSYRGKNTYCGENANYMEQ